MSRGGLTAGAMALAVVTSFCAAVVTAASSGQIRTSSIVLQVDWTKTPPRAGDVWNVDLGQGRVVPMTLAAAPACPGVTAFVLSGPSGSSLWGRLVVTANGVHAFIEDDGQARVWFVQPTDDRARLNLLDASQAPAPLAGFRCRMLTAPSAAAFAPPAILGGPKTQSWPGQVQTFTLAVAMTADVRKKPKVEDELLNIVQDASAVFERYTGISFCGVLATGETEFKDGLDPQLRAKVAQQSLAGGSLKNAYDLGVTFDHGGGSEAVRDSACDPTSSASTVVEYNADVWDAWRLAHELAHQFGATHTFEEPAADRVGATASEPGRGRTQLGYPRHLDGHWFHPLTLAQILEGRGRIVAKFKCGGKPLLSAVAPPALTPEAIVVPPRTPFRLSVHSQPPVGRDWLVSLDDATLDANGGPPGPPYFASLAPLFREWRLFPSDVSPIDAGGARVLTMVHDGAGAVSIAANTVRVASAKPFSAAAPVGWRAGDVNVLTWDPGETAKPPFAVTSVTVSVFDGKAWNVAARGVRNAGTAKICLLESEAGSAIRVRVEANGAAFFAETPAFAVAAAGSGRRCTR